MIDWLGIEHLFELSTGEKIAGLFTPLMIFIAFAIATLVLPGRWVPGYAVDKATGEPRRYRLNGLLVFVVAVLIWGFEVIPGVEREFFYRTSLYAVAGGTGFAVILHGAGGLHPAEDGEHEPDHRLLPRPRPGDPVLQRPPRPEDDLLRRGRHDAGHQRHVGRRLALRAVQPHQRSQPRRLRLRRHLHLLRVRLSRLRARPALHL